MLRVYFSNLYASDHQYFKKPGKSSFVFTVAFQYSKKSYKSISGISKKKLSLKFNYISK